MIDIKEFDKIRPFHEHEVNAAIHRMIKQPFFHAALQYLFSDEEQKEIIEELKIEETSFGFQKALMYRAISRILETTCTEFTYDNPEALLKNGPSVFVANHRDILLDSAILQLVLVDHGLETSEITFGSNLMINDFIVDFGKTNRMFTVFRSGNSREMLENSKRLSAYMHHTIQDKKRSSWIAQRKGRTKDGFDKTDTTVLKMLTTYNRKNPIEAFKAINIVPIVTSYEFEPCDLLKIRERYLSKDQQYVKQAGEDLQSILNGITQQKGGIHLVVGNRVNDFIEENIQSLDSSNIHQKVAEYIDSEVYLKYKLYPNNYWAFDQLKDSKDNADKYSNDTESQMLQRLEQLYQLIGTENKELKQMFLEMYANPVIQRNKLL